jgi:hypothetical protein
MINALITYNFKNRFKSIGMYIFNKICFNFFQAYQSHYQLLGLPTFITSFQRQAENSFFFQNWKFLCKSGFLDLETDVEQNW